METWGTLLCGRDGDGVVVTSAEARDVTCDVVVVAYDATLSL